MDENLELAVGFAKIYEKEWRQARQSLRKHKHDEEIVYLLMRIVRAAFDYCLDDNNRKHSTKDIMREFLHEQLPMALHKDQITPEVRVFIRKSVDYLHKMCDIQHGLSIAWTPKGEVIDREMYTVEGDGEKHVCDWTVWPAVVDSGGHVLTKGVIIPIT